MKKYKNLLSDKPEYENYSNNILRLTGDEEVELGMGCNCKKKDDCNSKKCKSGGSCCRKTKCCH